MRPKLFHTLSGVIAFVMLAYVPSRAQAQTTANGPYYPMPAWDQKLRCDTQATCPRFIVLSNWNGEAVLDRETGLVWEQSPDGTTRSWFAAQVHCNQRTVGNRKGWRLPTTQELASLTDPSVASPTLPAGHPFIDVQALYYWSATSNAANASDAWGVDFFTGDVFPTTKSFTNSVWCVRGGQGVDPQ